ncbi:Oidioi.mRNA.OKI2018_I69.chr1.g1627.t1.cds [Oikopleura dioica]|uniref:Oidioi.mRNA.OKI2018_I69.chr1.g1627.t1.cds n=1 Tax=Oikopleura dioica TaxID=34765 RepID=A0ABN7SVH8_OIKDI|nr:Oidioi.mRNA.OKI2018_I69.chr1.g1627.t1.cds [Oikopleura dioica]
MTISEAENTVPEDPTVVDGNDSDDELSAMVDFLGLQLNETTTSATFGGQTVPTKADTNVDTTLNVEDVINLLKMDEEALEAGRRACLAKHNGKRRQHRFTKDLYLGPESSKLAQAWAEQLAANPDTPWTYQPNQACGQNISKIIISGEVSATNKEDFEEFGRYAVEKWYKGEQNYNYVTEFKRNKNGLDVRPFIQVVWQAAKCLGVGIALTADKKAVYVVCRYSASRSNKYLKRKNNVHRLKHALVKDQLYLFGGRNSITRISRLDGCYFSELNVQLISEYKSGHGVITLDGGNKAMIYVMPISSKQTEVHLILSESGRLLASDDKVKKGSVICVTYGGDLENAWSNNDDNKAWISSAVVWGPQV